MVIELDVRWDFGIALAEEILESIALMASTRNLDSKDIERQDHKDFKIYWAGSVLRLDFPEKSFRG